jgi:hypothetical protein
LARRAQDHWVTQSIRLLGPYVAARMVPDDLLLQGAEWGAVTGGIGCHYCSEHLACPERAQALEETLSSPFVRVALTMHRAMDLGEGDALLSQRTQGETS